MLARNYIYINIIVFLGEEKVEEEEDRYGARVDCLLCGTDDGVPACYLRHDEDV